MKIERVTPKRYHCGQLARTMRHEHAAIIEANPHIKAHRNIVQFFERSTLVRAWTMDGKIAALAGVTGSMMDRDGIAWLILSQDAEAHPVAVGREALKFMDWARITKREIYIVVMADDRKAIDFAYFLDFQANGREPIAGVPCILMSARSRKAA